MSLSRLWHQLTGALLEFVRDDGNRRDDNFIKLFEEVSILCRRSLARERDRHIRHSSVLLVTAWPT